jgi:hypothetical protein
MSKGMSPTFTTQNELLHAELSKLHWYINKMALGTIKDALEILHTLEREQSGVRELARRYIHEFELLRAKLEDILPIAALLRSELIQENGCTGMCEEYAKKK